ncbi:MAG TPA: hypothetical protein VG013_04135 [Gemmataceae bacterium]|nr:hypothetical protein [Gemmataceae bacterium]
MQRCCMGVSWLGLIAGMLWASAATAQEAPELAWNSEPVPLAQIPATVRDHVRQTLERPTYTARGPAESFLCRPAMYHWFLEHPDRAVGAWRRLGARCVDIQDRGDGRFGWSDELGSDVHWDTVYRGPRMRVWYAEGRVKPGKLVPTLPVRAVVVLHYSEDRDNNSRAVMTQQAELFLHTDSKTAAVVARLVGASAPKLGAQYVAQLELFYSALSWYMEQHPKQAEALLSDSPPSEQP